MAALDVGLATGEKVIVDTRRSGALLLGPVVALLLLAVVTGGGLALLPMRWQPYGTWALLAVVAVLGLVSVVVPTLRWWVSECLITNRRIKTRTGVINTIRHDIPLSHIQQVSRSASLAERLYGSGSLRLTMTSGQVFVIPGLPRIAWLHSLLSELVWAYGPGHVN
ncbi:MAG: PH domain-containing protein [Propionibacteriaceae bacterium]|nr:PH domain-containing protein [Propionibacteriaceae bacterium]